MSGLLESITRPTLLLDEARVRANIRAMAEKAARSGAAFRPHFKTHQSAAVGEWFREAGVRAITVSSLGMAAYFAEHGWRDVTVAVPVNLREGALLNELAARIELGVLVDSERAARALGELLRSPAGVWIKIDAGYHRVGIPWDEPERVLGVLTALRAAPHLRFRGLLVHSGHSYHAPSPEAIRAIHAQSLERLADLKGRTLRAGAEECLLSVGDTPTASLVDSFAGADEVRPGNFVFYDLEQWQRGSCSAAQIAVAVACPVISLQPGRNQSVLHGGAVHLSKDCVQESGGRRIYGYAAPLVMEGGGAAPSRNGWGEPDPDLALVSLTQEHGVLEYPPGRAPDWKEGDLVCVLPVHSCLTANLYAEYLTLDGRRLARMAGAMAR